MTATPSVSRKDIADHRAVQERLESHVQPRAECCICGIEYREGPGPTSHGYCGDQCERLDSEPAYEATLLKLADDMMMAWGRYVGSRHGSGEWIAGKIAHGRARKRYAHALKQLVTRMEAELAEAKDALHDATYTPRVEDMERGR